MDRSAPTRAEQRCILLASYCAGPFPSFWTSTNGNSASDSASSEMHKPASSAKSFSLTVLKTVQVTARSFLRLLNLSVFCVLWLTPTALFSTKYWPHIMPTPAKRHAPTVSAITRISRGTVFSTGGLRWTWCVSPLIQMLLWTSRLPIGNRFFGSCGKQIRVPARQARA